MKFIFLMKVKQTLSVGELNNGAQCMTDRSTRLYRISAIPGILPALPSPAPAASASLSYKPTVFCGQVCGTPPESAARLAESRLRLIFEQQYEHRRRPPRKSPRQPPQPSERCVRIAGKPRCKWSRRLSGTLTRHSAQAPEACLPCGQRAGRTPKPLSGQRPPDADTASRMLIKQAMRRARPWRIAAPLNAHD